MPLSYKQYQQVLDAFTAGELVYVQELTIKSLQQHNYQHQLNQVFVETTHGVYVLVYYSPYPPIAHGGLGEHKLIARHHQFKYVQPIKGVKGAWVIHKFHHYFCLFAL